MYKPQLYAENGLHARRDTVEVLNKYLNELNLQKNAKVLDIGSGPGNVTHDILLPLLPKTTKKVIGIDVSEYMVNYAKKKYESIPKLSFYKMDVLIEKVPEQFYGEFHHVFSFYCLHMVDDHRKALENIYEMLKPGGSILLTFMGKCILYDIYESLIKDSRWKHYLRNYEKLIPVTHFHENPIPYYYKLMNEIGFETISCKADETVYEYPEQLLKNTMLAVNVFNIPTNEEEVFALDHLRVLKEKNLTKVDASNKVVYLFPYTLFIINAIKPRQK